MTTVEELSKGAEELIKLKFKEYADIQAKYFIDTEKDLTGKEQAKLEEKYEADTSKIIRDIENLKRTLHDINALSE